MEAEFYSVSTEARRFALYNSLGLHDLKASLKRWERELRAADPDSLPLFYDRHHNEIDRIVLQLRKIQDPQITGYHDRIFTKLFHVSKRIPTNLSRVFKEFIKGITYLEFQTTIEVPAYHRLQSCGPGDDAFRKTYQQCPPDMDRARRNDVRGKIETCYIERLIYDQMYENLTLHFPEKGSDEHHQNASHERRLELTHDDFKTCFPNLDVKVDLEFEMNWPVSVRICRYIRGDLVSVELYKKRIILGGGHKHYDDVVYASRNTKQYTYVKNQSFRYATKWKRIGETQKPLNEDALHNVTF